MVQIPSYYEMHYVEYDSYITQVGSGNEFILFSEPNNTNNISDANRIGAKKYFPDHYDKYLQPDVYQILNPEVQS